MCMRIYANVYMLKYVYVCMLFSFDEIIDQTLTIFSIEPEHYNDYNHTCQVLRFCRSHYGFNDNMKTKGRSRKTIMVLRMCFEIHFNRIHRVRYILVNC